MLPGRDRLEGKGLGEIARKTVEDEAIGGILSSNAVGEHSDHEIIGNEFARQHDLGRFSAEIGVGGDVAPQHVAGGDVRHPESGCSPLGLCALA